MRFLKMSTAKTVKPFLSNVFGLMRLRRSQYALVIATLFSLSACDSNSVGKVDASSASAAQIQMAPPSALLKAVDPSALILEVSVNGEAVEMTQDPVTGLRRGTIRLPVGTETNIEIVWSESFEGAKLVLGKANRAVNVASTSVGRQEVYFLESDFDFSEDTDNDDRSNLQERREDTDPLDDASPGVPPVLVPVVVRFQVPDERILQNADLLQNLTPLATFNGDDLALARTGDIWVGTTEATQNSSGFVSVTVYQNPDQRILLATAQRNQSVGGGAEFNFATDDYESANVDEDGDGLSNLEEIIQGYNPLDSNSPEKDPCETSQFAVGCITDSDGDGDPDSIETELVDTDGDGTPNYLESSLQDLDEDGRDAERDANDEDPCVPSVNNVACQNLIVDTDDDGKTDFQEGNGDRDGDGIPDFRESTLRDEDSDGVDNENDPSNTNPCIPNEDAEACAITTNDSDGDGKTDLQETTTRDSDSDGTPDYLESSLADSDGDNRVDELDPANDDPCVPSTSNTACADQTRDTDGDGESDLLETLTNDTDSDGIPDFRESSSNDEDNDGLADEFDRSNADACEPDPNNAACQSTLDTDGDTVLDINDNCPAIANTDQTNSDADAQGDACDSDDDNDSVTDLADNCPLVANLDQADADMDDIGDLCDTLTDTDGDTIADAVDNCPLVANLDQADADMDDIGDLCDTLTDTDGDTIADAVDNCPLVANLDQADADMDDIGDLCDTLTDTDGDTIADAIDNCPLVANLDQADADMDDIGDLCDTLTDTDGDTIADAIDNCPLIANLDQADTDMDDIGDLCDPTPI